jgi:peptidoglycan-associated lipoprotein
VQRRRGLGPPAATTTLRITVNDPTRALPFSADPVHPPPPVAPTLTNQQLVEKNMLSISFDYDKSDIRDDQRSKLQAENHLFESQTPIFAWSLKVTPMSAAARNTTGAGRSPPNAVKQYFVSQGIAETRMFTVSYGEERPVCSAKPRNAMP